MPKTKYHRSGEEIYGNVTISGSLSGPWQPGYLGNNQYIAIPPGDFILNQVALTNRPQNRAVELGISLNNGGSLHKPSTNGAPLGDNGIFAIKIIPKGFKAVSAIVHGIDTPPAAASRWAAYSSTLLVATSAPLVTGPPWPTVNNEVPFTSEVNGTGIHYVVLGWNRGNTTLSELLGAQIFIEPDV